MNAWIHIGWLAGRRALAVSLLFIQVATADIINLQAYITYALLDENGVPLADGSVVQIIASRDAVIDPLPTYGTNLLTGVTGDDVILSCVVISAYDLGSNGTFFAADSYYDTSEQFQYVYVRFFNTTGLVEGLVYWGTSSLVMLPQDNYGVVEVDFGGGNSATNFNNFVVIPEPNTLGLLVTGGGCMAWLVLAAKKNRAKRCRGLCLGRAWRPDAPCLLNPRVVQATERQGSSKAARFSPDGPEVRPYLFASTIKKGEEEERKG